jgi:UDP-N-acetylglucosamine 4-epimerase
MPSRYDELKAALTASPKTWLVTGAAGFIGSHLVEALLKLDQIVVGLDNFSTGKRENLREIETVVSGAQWQRFRFIEGDTRSLETCREACQSVDYVLHQAALGSVPRSIADPIRSHDSNVNGFLNMLVAARDAGVRRFVHASSSSVYGDYPDLPKQEDRIGRPLSPYAATKQANELYAGVFARCYGLELVGLRYFNVFGPRQDPDGPYAAVVPKWIAAMIHGEPVQINGDGETSRDFCYVANVVQANLLAATAPQSAIPAALNPQPCSTPSPGGEGRGEGEPLSSETASLSASHGERAGARCNSATGSSNLEPPTSQAHSALRTPHSAIPAAPCSLLMNIALNDRTTLNRLFDLIRERLEPDHAHLRDFKPVHCDFRAGDVRHSQADISRAQKWLGYQPTHTIAQGLDASMEWYKAHLRQSEGTTGPENRRRKTEDRRQESGSRNQPSELGTREASSVP